MRIKNFVHLMSLNPPKNRETNQKVSPHFRSSAGNGAWESRESVIGRCALKFLGPFGSLYPPCSRAYVPHDSPFSFKILPY